MKLIIKVPLIFITLILIFFLGASLYFINNQIVDFSVLENYTTSQPSILLDDEGKEWARFELDKRDPILLNQVPRHVINAFLAAEDRGFYDHHGISLRAILRSIFINLKTGRRSQGASTITQQLVKLLFFDSKKTFSRKIKEQFLAIVIESQFTKEQILETYLNHIYFGCGIYGISAACQRFFGKPVFEIDPSEAAVLAGIQRCPAVYCPLLNYNASLKRRNLVLNMMQSQGCFSKDLLNFYKNAPLILVQVEKSSTAPHLKEHIRLYLENMFGKTALYTSGMKIQTTLNRKLQLLAEQKFIEQFKRLKKDLTKDIDGGLISIDVKTGGIKALIGGFDFSKSQFNRAMQAKRQVGSIIKPFIYAQAIKNGANFAQTEVDEPIELIQGGSVWSPNNYNKKFTGEMTLAKGLCISNNIVAIKTLIKAGIDQVAALLKNSGLKGDILPYPSLALGCVDSTLIDFAAAFNIFANNGEYVEPHSIKWVKDAYGKKVWVYKPQSRHVLDSKITSQVNKVMNIGISRYLQKNNFNLNFEAIGKTGTTNDFRTCWFCGSSPELTTVIYMGKDDNSSLGKNIYRYPVSTVFPIWMQIYSGIGCGQNKFSYHPELKEVFVDWNSGSAAKFNVIDNCVALLL